MKICSVICPFGRATAGLVALACLLGACSAEPTVLFSERIVSPDGKTSALREQLDNGLGFGLGAIYEELHLVGPTEDPGNHGESSQTVAFYVNTSEYSGPAIEVSWLSNTHLLVKYDKSLKPGRQYSQLSGVKIEYVVK